MHEGPSEFENHESDAEKAKREMIALARELHESGEVFLFSGFKAEEYEKRKVSDQEFPEYSTPVDVLLERFKAEGMKVVLGKNPESSNVFVLPAGSDDIEMDSIFPRQLEVTPDMDERVRRLVEMGK